MTEKLEDARSLVESLETDDVGQKRYLMYQAFDLLLEATYEMKDRELPEKEERIAGLNGIDGYMYKLVQEFLTSSSTMEKGSKLEDMVEHVERNME